MDLIEELRWRGLLHQCTDEEGLREHLADPVNHPRKVYAGFDPTAPSLTIGNLVPIMLLAHVKRAGHVPVVLMGGGTGLIGDPSGKSAERTLMTPETVETHINAQRPIFERVLGGEKVVGSHPHTVVNNADWLTKISYLDALRDIGKFFSVNMMMQKESVKARLENREQGISYTEFSYMILQAYDFARLYMDEHVTVQMGGSDQFGNIVAGLDLVRKVNAVGFVVGPIEESQISKPDFGGSEYDEDGVVVYAEDEEALPAFGLTAPLVTKADGGKFGKTETGAVWLTADRTSPYAYSQFWLNASDADAANWIKIFTFLDKPTIDALLERHAANPGARELQRTLAREATAILHGEAAMEQAEAAGKAMFSGDIAGLDRQTLAEVLSDVPSSNRDRVDLGPDGVDLVEVLVETELAKSKREAREFLASGSVSVNGEKVGPDARLTEAHLLHGSMTAIRRGKKNWHLIRWS
ncbi:MAG: tyrosine--tRNA ligase [Planctomycetes bacterium]|nr:tyrosine--tRNA ligase [Planctomycetota bacterium]